MTTTVAITVPDHPSEPPGAGQQTDPASSRLLVFVPTTGQASSVARLPGAHEDDPFERLAAAWLLGVASPRTQRAYRLDLGGWARWCRAAGVHPLAVQRWHVDAYKTWLTTTPSARTGKAPATITRALSALSEFYSYAVAVQVLEHSPVADVKRPQVSADSQSVALTADELRAVLAQAHHHPPLPSRWCCC